MSVFFNNKSLKYLLLFFSISAISVSCRKTLEYEGDASLWFSEDIVTFDTVFTSITSITKKLVIKNQYAGDLYTDIALKEGLNSCFSVNINGQYLDGPKRICIPAKDSIFVFIKVNILPNQQDTPLLVVDTLNFVTNGNSQNISLLAFGQDAHFIVPDSKLGNISYKIVSGMHETKVWKNDKPYVIYGYAVVDSTAKLKIEAGTKIYVHKGGGLWVYKGGCIKVKGKKDSPVIFQGDRTESFFAKDYEQWDRIWINEGSEDNEINYAIIRNAYIGIQAEVLGSSMGNKLILSNTIIEKSSGIGVLGRSYKIEAYNNIIADCGQYALALVQGGDYNFYHNTICNFYFLGVRSTPSVFFSNYYDVANYRYLADFKADFVNNIIYGSFKREFSYVYTGSAKFEASMRYCLLKCDTVYKDVFGAAMILNEDPLFVDYRNEKYYLYANSPCKSKGLYMPEYAVDYNGDVRNNPPTMGAFEYEETK